ncbi:lipase family protein [Caulobacter sp. KR2-114]|uniref:lipase family protein n=1 Tax=Caulobacter sp. KR2-114 TaxID=3400912 RepID=UPI003C0F7828
MGQITSLAYAEIANRVYNIDQQGPVPGFGSWVVADFDSALFQEGMSWGATRTDYKGCVYVSRRCNEAVVAFQGTDLKKGGDIVADLQIALGGLVGMLPQYCEATVRLFRRTRQVYPNHQISFTGHSLGGALAQIMGHWTGLPFVTFNAPGVWGDIQKAKLAPWSTANQVRSLVGGAIGSPLAKQMASTGRNFRNVLDPVSAYGMHYGPVTRFWGAGLHSMDDLEARIRASRRWASVNPFDPAFKEWGEL